jgi:hypothetical protein
MATRGVMPKAVAVSAETVAICVWGGGWRGWGVEVFVLGGKGGGGVGGGRGGQRCLEGRKGDVCVCVCVCRGGLDKRY